MNRIVYFLLSLCLFCTSFIAQAQIEPEKQDDLSTYIDSMAEQEIMVRWVIENSGKEMTQSQATKIVRNAYAYAISHDLKPSLILAMIKKESTFKPKARSGAGAKGLMQVIPKWHQDKLKGRDPYGIQVSIEVGSQVIKDCLIKHNQNQRKALGCYSGGARNYASLIGGFQKQLANYVSRAMYARNILMALNGPFPVHP